MWSIGVCWWLLITPAHYTRYAQLVSYEIRLSVCMKSVEFMEVWSMLDNLLWIYICKVIKIWQKTKIQNQTQTDKA